jgi:hypothetical protein
MMKQLNDAPIIDQLEGQWQKLFMALLWKLKQREAVRLTAADFAALEDAYPGSIPVLFTHGMSDALEFQILDEAAAARIGEYEKSRSGNA